jgi:membrane associated rhomboid family serine protease
MSVYRSGRGFFEIPHTATFVLLTANVIIFGLCARYSDASAISGELLLRNGAMYSSALHRGEYWRLVTYGFLHANIVHLATNMLCLVLWGGHLEKRIGACYFLLLYLCSVVAGGVTSNLARTDQYLSVGASGGISGILGGLLCLWLLRKIDLSINFFVANIGLNVVLGFSAPRVDWAAHLGGFTAGIVICALLELLEKSLRFLLRCRFPEFVKLNLFIAGVASAILLWRGGPTQVLSGTNSAPLVVTLVAASMIVIKMFDLIMPLKKGLAIVVLSLSAMNALLACLMGVVLAPSITATCATTLPDFVSPFGVELFRSLCANPFLAVGIVSLLAFASTILLYAQDLQRGINDIGFIGASLRGERKRRDGI